MTATTTTTGALLRASVVAMLVGATIMVLLHESSHAAAAAILGYQPTQLPFAVGAQPTPEPAHEAIIAITGPIFSLAFGLVGVVVDRVATPLRDRPFWRLVWLWTVFCSLMEGIGYVMIAGLADAGDTAVAFGIWGVPDWVYISSIVVGFAAMFGLGVLFSRPLIGMTHSMAEKNAIAVWTWMIGTVLFMALMGAYVLISPGVPIEAIVAVMAGALAIAVFAPISMMFGSSRFGAAAPIEVPRHPVGGYSLLAVLIVVNLVLSRGWIWG